jgi:hypothetical protein
MLGDDDGFLLRGDAGGLTIVSGLPRGVLHGVYAYLESMGVRFPFPGAEHEVVPRCAWTLESYDRREIPSFARRGISLAIAPEEAPGWLDFCGKQRLNWVFLHTPDEDWWPAHRERLLPELAKRGLSLELGGHFLPRLLPRDLFAGHPDWFRMVDGERVNDFNFCPASKEALAYLGERACAYVREAPEAEVYHLWADDTEENASTWCSCPRCAGYTPSEQNLLVMNALARAIRTVKPTARLAHLAYHETLAPPRAVQPDPGLVLLFAPRERCYAHALDDPECAKNREHAAWLEALLGVFGPERTEVFEYYPDQYVFNSMAPALPDVIRGDARYFHRLGIGLIEPLLIRSTRPWLTPPAAAILQSAIQRDVAADPWEHLADHARTYYGDEAMVEFVMVREEMVRRVMRACDFTHPVTIFWTPPIDRPDVTARYLKELEPAFRLLREARALLARVGLGADPAYAARINGAEQVLDVTGKHVSGQAHLARAILAYNRFRVAGQMEDGLEAIQLFEHAHACLNTIWPAGSWSTRTFAIVDTYMRDIDGALMRSDDDDIAEDIALFLEYLPEVLVATRTAGLEGSYGLVLDGAGAWTLEIRDGQARVSEGMPENPLASLRMAPADFMALMRGELPPMDAWRQGRLRMAGDAARLFRLPGTFRVVG